MSSAGSWLSQPVGDLGATLSEGIRNSLGRPPIDPLTILVREAAQNSWDARLYDQTPDVRFTVELATLDQQQRERWAAELIPGAPAPESVPFEESIASDTLRLLLVSDRGTRGLGGPVRGSIAPGADGQADYVSFVLNAGSPRDEVQGGGTYGFGKSIFYNVSRCFTIVIYTRCIGELGTPESRLIAVSIGSSFAREGRQFTGRHWWGLTAGDGLAVDPLTKETADELALSLGLPGFDGDETGTTIAIVDPDLDERTSAQAAGHIADAIVWNLWPKMVERPGQPVSMTFRVTADGAEVPVPAPQTQRYLNGFAEALTNVADGLALNHRALGCELGRLAFVKGFAVPEALPLAAREAGIKDGVHHVCLLRAPELVVRYLPCEPIPDELAWYVGVFRADDADDVEAAFASSEPPAHDDWIVEQLRGNARKQVDWALKQIRKSAKTYVTPTALHVAQAETVALGGASSALASLIAPASGGGAESARATRPDRGPTGSRRRSLRMVGEPRWERVDGLLVLAQDFNVTATESIVVEVRLGISEWGSKRLNETALGELGGPELRGWRVGGGRIIGSRTLRLEAGTHEGVSVVVRAAPDTVTLIDLQVNPAEETP